MSASPQESLHDLWIRHAGEICRFALHFVRHRVTVKGKELVMDLTRGEARKVVDAR